MILPTYEAANITASWGYGGAALDLTEGGLGSDVFLDVVQTNAMVEVTRGADGSMAPSKMSSKGGTITLTLQQTAPLNKKLAKVAGLQMKIGAPLVVGNFTVIDKTAASAHFVAINAILTAQADHSFGATGGEKTWVWECEAFIPTDEPLTFTTGLTDYIVQGL